MSDVRGRLTAALADRCTIDGAIGGDGMAMAASADAVRALSPERVAIRTGYLVLREDRVTTKPTHPLFLTSIDRDKPEER